MDKFIEYAPLVMVVCAFLLKNKIFITPDQLNKALKDKKNNYKEECKELYVTKEEMQIERKQLLEEVEQRFLSIVAFREFEKRIDSNFEDNSKRFDKIDRNLEYMKGLLIKRK